MKYTMESQKKPDIRAIIFCSLIMTATAASDALRGVFLPQFRSTFALSETQSSRIIMFSYIGNLLFLMIGGRLSDKLPRKRFLTGLIGLWAAALALHVFTENYYVLMFVIMFTMGGSTMISTTINLVTPLLFASPVFYVNIFNFCQGIGITGSQNIGGRFADKMTSWHIANGIILSIAVISLIILLTMKFPKEEQSSGKKASFADIIRSRAFLPLIFITGGYFVSEHGVQNWLVSYCSEELDIPVSKGAVYLSMFYGALTVGRLIFAPAVSRLGVNKSMLIFPGATAVVFTIGILLGDKGLYVLAASGLGVSVLYPVLVLFISSCYDSSVAGSATGLVLSVATLFDIGFNALFGRLIEAFGYSRSILLLPAAIILFAVGLALFIKLGRKEDRADAE